MDTKKDKELIAEASALPFIYCDGFGAFRLVNGILRTVGFVLQGGAVLNLGVSPLGAEEAQLETQRTLQEGLTHEVQYWRGHRAHH